MNSVQPHPTPILRIVPKPQVTEARLPLRRLVPHQGILWTTIPATFMRYGWDIQEQTDFFIKAYHHKTNQSVIISKMGQGTVLVNQNYETSSASELHEIETIADIQNPSATQNHKSHRLLMGMLVLLRMMF